LFLRLKVWDKLKTSTCQNLFFRKFLFCVPLHYLVPPGLEKCWIQTSPGNFSYSSYTKIFCHPILSSLPSRICSLSSLASHLNLRIVYQVPHQKNNTFIVLHLGFFLMLLKELTFVSAFHSSVLLSIF
jgi:hypothetical protein